MKIFPFLASPAFAFPLRWFTLDVYFLAFAFPSRWFTLDVYFLEFAFAFARHVWTRLYFTRMHKLLGSDLCCIYSTVSSEPSTGVLKTEKYMYLAIMRIHIIAEKIKRSRVFLDCLQLILKCRYRMQWRARWICFKPRSGSQFIFRRAHRNISDPRLQFQHTPQLVSIRLTPSYCKWPCESWYEQLLTCKITAFSHRATGFHHRKESATYFQ